MEKKKMKKKDTRSIQNVLRINRPLFSMYIHLKKLECSLLFDPWMANVKTVVGWFQFFVRENVCTVQCFIYCISSQKKVIILKQLCMHTVFQDVITRQLHSKLHKLHIQISLLF